MRCPEHVAIKKQLNSISTKGAPHRGQRLIPNELAEGQLARPWRSPFPLSPVSVASPHAPPARKDSATIYRALIYPAPSRARASKCRRMEPTSSSLERTLLGPGGKWPPGLGPQIPFANLRVIRCLRCGSFGVVYRARLGGRPVALKLLLSEEPVPTELFVQEAAILAALDHRCEPPAGCKTCSRIEPVVELLAWRVFWGDGEEIVRVRGAGELGWITGRSAGGRVRRRPVPGCGAIGPVCACMGACSLSSRELRRDFRDAGTGLGPAARPRVCARGRSQKIRAGRGLVGRAMLMGALDCVPIGG